MDNFQIKNKMGTAPEANPGLIPPGDPRNATRPSSTKLACLQQDNPLDAIGNQLGGPDHDHLVPSVNAVLQINTAPWTSETLSVQADLEDNGWHVPNAVTYELVGLFFDIVQKWLPILHRPQFYQKYIRIEGPCARIVNRQSVNDHEAVLINSMFALAARFSKARFFASTDPVTRGDVFAERAAATKDPILKVIEEPSLEFVKACVLLAFYNLTAGQTAPGARLTSVCVRFAYDLGLNEIDDEDQINGGGDPYDAHIIRPDVWVEKEERRRLWWVIFELDCFVSTVSCQPYGVERGGMKVLLPASDHHWFNYLPIRSSYLIHQPSAIWKTLQGSPNQSPRAWYLVTNYLKSCFADAARQPRRNTSETQAELENALACLQLAFPAEFQLRSLNIDENNFGDGNWIISTHFMVLACETILERMKWSESRSELSFDAVREASLFGKHFYSRLVRAAQVWPSEYIPLNHPFMGCCLINPWDAFLEGQHEPKFQSYELSKLLLDHYSRFWKIGSALLRLLTIIHEGKDTAIHKPGSKEREIIRRFSILCPRSLPKEKNSVASRLNAPLSHKEPVEAVTETLPSPSQTNFESPGDLRWPLSLWDNLQDFDVDQSEPPEMLNTPPGTHGDHLRNPMDKVASSQMHAPGFSPALDAFADEFVTL